MSGTQNKKVWLGIAAATAVYAIYGLNMVYCKDLTGPGLLSPLVLFSIRTGGAALLFWILSIFVPGERLTAKELGMTILASLLLVIIPQYSTLIGITMSSPYDASLVATLKPVLTMSVALLFAREKFSVYLLVGVLLTFLGAVVLVIHPGEGPTAFSTRPLGFVVLLLNGISFAFYIVLFKEFVTRHKTIVLMKWMFLAAFLISLPIAAPSLIHDSFPSFDGRMIAEILFMVLFATFITHFLIPVGQRNLKATHYSLFSYVQCIVAAIAGYLMGLEALDWQKIVASVLFVAGVAVVRRAR